jgi:hypothetical protein
MKNSGSLKWRGVEAIDLIYFSTADPATPIEGAAS